MNNKTREQLKASALMIGLSILVLGAAYLAICGLWALVCVGFGLTWSWVTPLGVWAILLLLRWFLVPKKED